MALVGEIVTTLSLPCHNTHDCVFVSLSRLAPGFLKHSKTPHVVTVLWQDSEDVVTILSPTRNPVEGYKTVYLSHLDSYTVTVCNGYLVSSHVVTVQLPTSCLVDRLLHRPHGSGYLITCVSDVVTIQQSQCMGLEKQWRHRHSDSHCVVTVPSRWLME